MALNCKHVFNFKCHQQTIKHRLVHVESLCVYYSSCFYITVYNVTNHWSEAIKMRTTSWEVNVDFPRGSGSPAMKIRNFHHRLRATNGEMTAGQSSFKIRNNVVQVQPCLSIHCWLRAFPRTVSAILHHNVKNGLVMEGFIEVRV